MAHYPKNPQAAGFSEHRFLISFNMQISFYHLKEFYSSSLLNSMLFR